MKIRRIQTFISSTMILSLSLGVLIGCGSSNTTQAEETTGADTVFQEDEVEEQVQEEEVSLTDSEAYVQKRYQEKYQKYSALYNQYKDQDDPESIQKARTYKILMDQYLEKIQGKDIVEPSTILENSELVSQERYRRKHEKYSALYNQYKDQDDPESIQKARTYKILMDQYLERLSSN